MKILLTGATGLTGSVILAMLAGRHEIHAIFRPGSTPTTYDGVRWIELDLSRPFAAHLPEQIDAVIHLAQSRRYRDFPTGAVDVFEISAGATVRLLQWCVKAGGSRFVYASSGAVYPPRPTPLREDDPTGPGSFYAFSKLVGEQTLQQFRDILTLTTLRFFFIYGPRQRGMLIPGLIDKIRAGHEVPLAGERGIRVNPVYVEDACSAVVAALTLEESGTFNVAGPDVVTIGEIAELIAVELALKVRLSHGPAQSDLIADTQRMRKYLTLPAVGMRVGLHRTLAAEGVDHQPQS